MRIAEVRGCHPNTQRIDTLRTVTELPVLVAANCEITVRPTGAQRLSRHCMRYDRSTQEFTYRWKLGARQTGTVNLEIQFTSVSTVRDQVTITHR